MFEEGKRYTNRNGTYTVLAVNGPRMKVRYDDGTEAELNVRLQQRIWDNIVAEQEARQMRRAVRKRSALDARYLIHTVGAPVEELTDPGWAQRVGVKGDLAQQLRAGDRMLFYAVDSQAFVAAGTITGTVATPKDASSSEHSSTIAYFSVELDAHAIDVDEAVLLDSADLENEGQLRPLLNRPGSDILIQEDEFEDVAEMLTEHTEIEDEEEEVELEDEDEYE